MAEFQSTFCQSTSFLTEAEKHELINYTLQQAMDFVPTTIATNALNYRQSQVLYVLPELLQPWVNHIRAVTPGVLGQLGLPSFPIAENLMLLQTAVLLSTVGFGANILHLSPTAYYLSPIAYRLPPIAQNLLPN
ncbi:MAG: hypothetical protein F6K19_41690 [Cyanothece sp. SIO1E1]|nr:hypothetical protein [Cyanothece sp. SIO1E1]